jgi:integron integrase
MERFETGLARERKSPATVETYRSHVRQFFGFKVDEDSDEFREFLHDYDFLETRVSLYLSTLAEKRSPATQAQALNALVCFYRLIGRPLKTLPEWARPKERVRVPNWVTVEEARAIISHLREPWNEVASMLIGSGLRIGECLDLRVKDLDLARGTVTIRGGKGDKDRITLLAKSMIPELRRRMECSRAVWAEDRNARRPGVALPDSLATKYPRAGEEWAWFWLWPAPGESTDKASGIVRRHHRHEEGFSKALKIAVRRSGVSKRVTAHTFRHGFASAYLEHGGTIEELRELMGHTSIETTKIYLHCLPRLASRAVSPLDHATSNITDFKRSA